MTYIEREITIAIKKALDDMPVVVITGMRQVGKTTLLQKQTELIGRRYITFDDFAYLEAARLNPEGFLTADGPLTIDEAQRCPEILTTIKREVDKNRQPGRFLLSGSANFSLLKGISETLAGRAIYFTLHPFSYREINKKISKNPFILQFFQTQKIPARKETEPITDEDILSGGMPPVCLGLVQERGLWFKSFEQTYLERDVRDLSQITNIIAFRQLIRLSALRTGNLLSPSDIGRDAKLTTATASRYLSLLETSFIINRIPPFLRSRASRLIKSPKMYIGDSGLACYLAGIQNLVDEPLKGAMFETYVAQQLLSIIGARCPDAELFFWNVQGRNEVDFVIESQGRCIAIEVKAASRWTEKDLSGLRAFLSSTHNCLIAILAYNGRDAVPVGEKIWAIPVSTLIS